LADPECIETASEHLRDAKYVKGCPIDA
jgi:hypothetical protein